MEYFASQNPRSSSFRFENLISGPKSYRDFRETGPRPQVLEALSKWPNKVNRVGKSIPVYVTRLSHIRKLFLAKKSF